MATRVGCSERQWGTAAEARQNAPRSRIRLEREDKEPAYRHRHDGKQRKVLDHVAAFVRGMLPAGAVRPIRFPVHDSPFLVAGLGFGPRTPLPPLCCNVDQL